MEPLIFKIETQADDSGVRQYDKSLGGLDVSSKKASGALKSFSHQLLQAKSGADVAAAGAESLSRVLEKSLAGAVVIGGIKIISDQINKMSEVLRSSGEAASAAITQLERMGEIKGIEDATKATGALNSSIDAITKNLGAIQDGNWFTKITASITGTTEELGKLLVSQERLRDVTIAYGFAAERNKAETMSRLNDEQKKYEQIQETLKKRLEVIDQIKNADARASATRDAYALAGIENLNLQTSLMAEQSKKEEEASKQRQKEIDAQIKKEQELAAVQQKRFNDLYNAEVKAQEETQKRIDANLKAEQDLADNQKGLQDNLKSAKEATPSGGGGGGGAAVGAGLTAPGLGKLAGQRETSAARGSREQAERAEAQGKQQEQQRFRENVSQQLKEKGQASDQNAVTNELIRRNNEAANAQGRASEGLKKYNDDIAAAKAEQESFNESLANSKSDFSDLGKGMSELVPEFNKAQQDVDSFSKGLTENSKNMVDDFLKAGAQSSDLGKEFDKTSEAVKKIGEELKKPTPAPPPSSRGERGKGEGSLESIEKLLQKNFDELKAYAHAT